MPLIIDSIEYEDSVTDPTVNGQVKQVNGRMKVKRSGQVVALVDCVGKAVDPVATDDGASGYPLGSVWINTATDTVFESVDASTGAAIWNESLKIGHAHTEADITDLHSHANQASLDLISGTNTGDESTFAGAGTSGIVPDPVTASGNFLKDDGTWAAGGGGGGDPTAQWTTPATVTRNTSSTIYGLMTGMEKTALAAGNYLVFFGGSFSQTSNNVDSYLAIYADGSQVTGSPIHINVRSVNWQSFAYSGFPVTVSASGSIKIYWKTGTGTLSCENPQLSIIKVA